MKATSEHRETTVRLLTPQTKVRTDETDTARWPCHLWSHRPSKRNPKTSDERVSIRRQGLSPAAYHKAITESPR